MKKHHFAIEVTEENVPKFLEDMFCIGVEPKLVNITGGEKKGHKRTFKGRMPATQKVKILFRAWPAKSTTGTKSHRLYQHLKKKYKNGDAMLRGDLKADCAKVGVDAATVNVLTQNGAIELLTV